MDLRRWVFWIATTVGIGLAAALAFPLIGGLFDYVLEEGGTLNSGACIGLAVLSGALGTFAAWFYSINNPIKSGVSEYREREIKFIKTLSKCFLFSAFCFSILALLSPYFPIGSSDLGSFQDLVKYTSLVSTIGGGICFVFSVVLGAIYIWFW